ALTNSSRGIQHAWHLRHALGLVIKGDAVTSVLRASPLNWALCKYSNQPIFQCSGLGYWRK
ncbi:hypothetical protein ABRZ80_22660, partial [Vibrio vulnificus]|uniref:hypothetical protein n=1 Tax=Vibrio vulnificus TaxID=672 RepID=UPI0027D2994E